MQKEEIYKYLKSLENNSNKDKVAILKSAIDNMSEEEFESQLSKLEYNKDKIKEVIDTKLERLVDRNEKKPINDMFTYGVSSNCVHLHLPQDLKDTISKLGLKGTLDKINLSLLDALDKVYAKTKNDKSFSNIDGIYMISPALINKEIEFLEGLDFETHLYKKKDLKNEQFVKNTPEAQLAVSIFGSKANIGTAKISIKQMEEDSWKEKKNLEVDRLERALNIYPNIMLDKLRSQVYSETEQDKMLLNEEKNIERKIEDKTI